MVKWLVGLALFLYAALWFGGADKGQVRAGLRDAPAENTVNVGVAPAPVPDPPKPIIAAAELVPMLPRPPITVKPAPAPEPTLGLAALTQDATADEAMVQSALESENLGTTLRWVAVERANVRAEARKSAAVTGRIELGEAVAVLWVEPNGWVRVRIEGDGIDGFVHESLLTDLNPQFQ